MTDETYSNPAMDKAILQAAISKLCRLMAQGTQGEWRTDGPDHHYYSADSTDYVQTSLISAGTERRGVLRALAPDDLTLHANPRFRGPIYEQWAPKAEADMQLIAVMHASLKAQLAILQSAYDDAEGSHDEPNAFALALTLAQGINAS